MQGFFAPGDSWLHRLDPVSKLLAAGVAVALLFVLPTVAANAAIIAAACALLGSAGVLRSAARPLAAALVVALTFLVVQGLAYPGNATPALRVGPVVFFQEGLLLGLLLALRLYGILTGTLLLLLTTSPVDLVESLVRRGLSPRIGYVIASVVQILPTVVDRYGRVRDAQRARGLETEGPIWTRLRAAVPLLGPVVTSSLIATEERALALEVRGFASRDPRTFLTVEERPGFVWLFRGACAIVLASAVLWRLVR